MEKQDLLLAIEEYMLEKNLSKTETTVFKLIDMIGEDILEEDEF
ncbi:hypothetical protein ACQUY5_22255 [Bacillus cereus]